MTAQVKLLPPDDFPLAADDPLREAHLWIQRAVDDVSATGQTGLGSATLRPHERNLDKSRDDSFRLAVLRAAARRLGHAGQRWPDQTRVYEPAWSATGFLSVWLLDHLTLQGRGQPRGTTSAGRAIVAPDTAAVADLAATAASQAGPSSAGRLGLAPLRALLKAAKPLAKRGELSDETRAHLAAAAERCRAFGDRDKPLAGLADRLETLAGTP